MSGFCVGLGYGIPPQNCFVDGQSRVESRLTNTQLRIWCGVCHKVGNGQELYRSGISPDQDIADHQIHHAGMASGYHGISLPSRSAIKFKHDGAANPHGQIIGSTTVRTIGNTKLSVAYRV